MLRSVRHDEIRDRSGRSEAIPLAAKLLVVEMARQYLVGADRRRVSSFVTFT